MGAFNLDMPGPQLKYPGNRVRPMIEAALLGESFLLFEIRGQHFLSVILIV